MRVGFQLIAHDRKAIPWYLRLLWVVLIPYWPLHFIFTGKLILCLSKESTTLPMGWDGK